MERNLNDHVGKLREEINELRDKAYQFPMIPTVMADLADRMDETLDRVEESM